MGVEASVVIDFESAADADSVSGVIVVELDDTHPNNLDAEGQPRSSFYPDDEPVFLIHHDNTIEVLDVRCTDGRVTSLGTNERRDRSLEGVFTKEETEISIPYSGVTSVDTEWFGNLGAVYVEDSNLKISTGEFPCYCKADYEVVFNQQWRLTPPSLNLAEDETYTIYVVVYVREVVT